MTLRHLTEAPAWPQLPRRDFRENMYAQYCEGLPGVVIDAERRKVYCETSRDLLAGMEEVYRAYLEGEKGAFPISEEHASGLYALARMVRAGGKRYPLLKGQVTGPISFGLTVLDENKRPILYNDELAEAMIRLLNLKARWMEAFLKDTGAAGEVLIFFDEPYLVSVGSALVSVSPQRVVEALRACAEGLTCLTGTHCCGNTDWGTLFRCGLGVVNFDAYGYLESMALYPQELASFLEGGGVLAWGLTVNDARIDAQTVDGLAGRFEEGVELLASRGVPRELLMERAMFTPSCGLEGVTPAQAERAYELTSRLSGRMRGQSGK